MRKLLVITAVLLLLVVSLLAVLLVSLNRIVALNRDRILGMATQQIGRPVRAGELSVDFRRGLGIHVAEFSVAEDAAFGREPFLDAESVTVRVRLWPLIRGDLELDAVDLIEPRVRLVRSAAGVWNFSTLLDVASERSRPARRRFLAARPAAGSILLPAAFAAAREPDSVGLRWAVDRVTLHAATLELVDRGRRPASVLRLAPIDGTLTSLSLQTPIGFAVEVGFPELAVSVSASGTVGPVRRAPLSLQLRGTAGPFGPQAVQVDIDDLTAALEGGRLTVASLRGRACGGSFSARGALPLGGAGPAHVLGQLKDAGLSDVLSLFSRDYGRFDGTAQVDFDLASAAAPEDARGTVVVDVNDGALHGFNLVDEVLRDLAPVPGFAEAVRGSLKPKYARLFAASSTHFEELHGTFRIADRQLRTDDLTVTADDFGARAAGTVAFDRRVDVSGDLVLSPQLTADLIADVREVRYIARDDGRLALPFRLRGLLGEAKPKPDTERVAALFSRALSRGAARDLLDGLLGRETKKGSRGGEKRDRLDERLRDLLGQ